MTLDDHILILSINAADKRKLVGIRSFSLSKSFLSGSNEQLGASVGQEKRSAMLQECIE